MPQENIKADAHLDRELTCYRLMVTDAVRWVRLIARLLSVELNGISRVVVVDTVQYSVTPGRSTSKREVSNKLRCLTPPLKN